MSDEEPKADIWMTRERLLCGAHGEPFREGWPAGFPLFMAEGFRRWIEKPETHGQIYRGEFENGPSTKAIEAALDHIPLCCRLTSAELLDLYAWINEQHEGKRWPKRRCDLCRERAWGGPYRWRDPETAEERSAEHLCLRCVVYRVIRGPRDATQQ